MTYKSFGATAGTAGGSPPPPPPARLKKVRLLFLQWWSEPIGVAVPVFALFIVLFAPQMPDMFAGAGTAGFGFSAALLGFSAWYWTRAALLAREGIDDASRAAANAKRRAAKQPHNDEEWSREWAPRLALLAALVIALAPLLIGVTHHGRSFADVPLIPVLLGVLWVVAAFLVVVYRQRLHLAGGAKARSWMWRRRVTAILAAAPFGWPVAATLLTLTVAGSLTVAIWPQGVELLAAPSAAIIALALVVPPLVIALAVFRSVATRLIFLVAAGYARTPRGRPAEPPSLAAFAGAGDVLGLLLLLFWLYLWPTPGQRFELRQGTALNAEAWEKCPNPTGKSLHEADYGTHGDRRPCIGQALEHWRNAQIAAGYPEDRDMPVVIVAVEGGASRSAAWLLSALHFLDVETGNRFGRFLFAISGVSGGSLGAATYALAVHRYPRAGGGLDWGAENVTAGMAQLAGGDLLSASVATYFLNDTLARLFGSLWPAEDRGVALERAFERLWQQPAGLKIPQDLAEGGLLALYAGKHDDPPIGLPHLILNGTDEKTGRRLITSTIRFHPDDDLFAASDDVLRVRDQDVHLATAVTNSARFPYISPPGQITRREIKKVDGKDKVRDYQWHILDGGYFENYGARTAADLSRAVSQISSRLHWRLVPIVVVVSNDADAYRTVDAAVPGSENHLLDKETVSCARHGSAAAAPLSPATGEERNSQNFGLGDEVVAPLLGLYATRGAHGQDALHLLRRSHCPQPGEEGPVRMVHIALPRPQPPKEAAPLNWVLNGEAKYFLLDVAPCLPFNRKQAVLLATTLDGMTGAQTAQVDSGAERAEFCRDSHPSRLVRAAIATSAE